MIFLFHTSLLFDSFSLFFSSWLTDKQEISWKEWTLCTCYFRVAVRNRPEENIKSQVLPSAAKLNSSQPINESRDRSSSWTVHFVEGCLIVCVCLSSSCLPCFFLGMRHWSFLPFFSAVLHQFSPINYHFVLRNLLEKTSGIHSWETSLCGSLCADGIWLLKSDVENRSLIVIHHSSLVAFLPYWLAMWPWCGGGFDGIKPEYVLSFRTRAGRAWKSCSPRSSATNCKGGNCRFPIDENWRFLSVFWTLTFVVLCCFSHNAIGDYLSSSGFQESLQAFKREAALVCNGYCIFAVRLVYFLCLYLAVNVGEKESFGLIGWPWGGS